MELRSILAIRAVKDKTHDGAARRFRRRIQSPPVDSHDAANDLEPNAEMISAHRISSRGGIARKKAGIVANRNRTTRSGGHFDGGFGRGVVDGILNQISNGIIEKRGVAQDRAGIEIHEGDRVSVIVDPWCNIS